LNVLNSLTVLFDAVLSRLTEHPFDLEFAVTYRCNLKCVQCNIWRLNPNLTRGEVLELSLQEIRKIFLSYRGFEIIGITGGEPFLREDLPQIVDVLAQTQRRLKTLFITTNGQLSSRIKVAVKRILENHGNLKVTVLVSVDGPSELHDEVRGVLGAYEKALKTISHLAGLRRFFSNLSLGTVTVCSPFNIQAFAEVLEEVKSLKSEFTLEPSFCVWFQGHLYKNLGSLYREVDGFRKALTKFIPSIKSTVKNGGAVSHGRRIFYDLLDLWLRDPIHQAVPCEAAKIRFFLDPYGDIYPCTIFNFPMGNLREYDYDFNKVFRSPIRWEARKLIKREACPVCCNTCETIPSMMSHPLNTFKSWIKSKRMRMNK
jgi:radical SAM protein with 4Fe4S-binding SPASM domain